MKYRNPVPTVDIIILKQDENGQIDKTQIVLVERKNPPYGWALPGGFVDYGETLEQAAIREAKEETSMNVNLIRQFHAYSDPARDPRQHTITVVFVATSKDQPKGGDDAKIARFFKIDNLPDEIAFDHRSIIKDFIDNKY